MNPPTALVLGKFLPPHAGHLYLVDFAQRHADHLTVVVGTLPDEPIPGELRYQWMRELCPGARVVHLPDPLPQHPDEHPEFWSLWRAALQRVVGRPIKAVYASEDYGPKLAEILGAEFVPVDPGRQALSISGTAVRADPLGHWQHLPPCVRAHYVRRVCVFGPESTGKTTLAKGLAAELDTVWVPEYARTVIEGRGGDISPDDFPRIVSGQIASEEALARRANRVLISDTDVIASLLWSEALFGEVPARLRADADARKHDLYLLCDVDVPWVDDIARYMPEDRASFFHRCQQELEQRGCRIVHIRGDWESRWQTALDAVHQLLAEPL